MVHEKEICSFTLNEIKYLNILIFLLLSAVFITLSLYLDSILFAVLPIIILITFFPLLVYPWDVVLSNKRFILRRRYWFVGRFSNLVSFKLKHLDTSSVTPRIKFIPLFLGYGILSSISLPIAQFTTEHNLPLPLILSIFISVMDMLGFGRYSGKSQLHNITSIIVDTVDPNSIILRTLLFSSLIIGGIIFALGLPWRKSVVLRSGGGHILKLNFGLPDILTKYLDSVGRKHRPKESSEDWKWNIPLLEGEEVLHTGKVGVINKGQFILGLVSILLFVQSALSGIMFSYSMLLIVPINLISLLLTVQSIVFAKSYRRIKATNHRLIFQEELPVVSGIFGKRLYRYTDMPFKNIQSYKYSRFTTITPSSYIMAFIIYSIGLLLGIASRNIGITIFSVVMVFLFVLLNYSTYTNLEFLSISGRIFRINYRLPFFMEKLSHRLENHSTIYSKLFPNSLPEAAVIGILRTIRGKVNLNSKHEGHKVEHTDLVGDEIPIDTWNKLAPYKFAIPSVIVSAVFVSIVLIYALVVLGIKDGILLLFIGGIITFMISIRRIVLVRYSLKLYQGRMFKIVETLPSNVAIALGIIPFNEIEEVNLRYVTSFKYRLYSQIRTGAIFSSTVVIVISTIIILTYKTYSMVFGWQFIFSTGIIILVLTIPELLYLIVRAIPRYSLIIQRRFGLVRIPHMERLHEFIGHVEEALLR